MEKIYLKPTTRELLIKGSASDGHLDVFSYDGNGQDAARTLGNLFVIGHVQHATDDMAYSINLISALAKREYYARPGTGAREAFSNTLKKVNEVIEEFFKHKGLKINVGVFAIAGEQLYLSKLGKFKLLLARDKKTVDVLNNIELFDKELTQEKQFSNIISGKVQDGDKILAFYPSRSLAARERTLKEHLVKLPEAEFAEKVESIKRGKEDFACAALYINLQETKEAATTPRIQPQELDGARLASAQELGTPGKKARKSKEESPDTAASHAAPPESSPSQTEPTEMPRIIPAEFSLGRKDNPLQVMLHRIRFSNMTPAKKAIGALAGAALIIVVSLAVKSYFLVSPQEQALRDTIDEAQSNAKLARTRISQNDFSGARNLLASSLNALEPFEQKGESSASQVREEIFAILDELDQAQEVFPSLAYQGTSEQKLLMIGVGADGLIAVSPGGEGADHKLLVIKNGAVTEEVALNGLTPLLLFGDSGTWLALDTASLKFITRKEGKSYNGTLPSDTAIGDSKLYDTNLYILSGRGIIKVSDAILGHEKTSSWLQSETTLPDQSSLLAVDGTIYVISRNGTLTSFYKGKEVKRVETGLVVGAKSMLLTGSEPSPLFLINRDTKRIYLISKEDGALLKTLKVSSQADIIHAAVSPDEGIYVLTSDQKIWKIQ